MSRIDDVIFFREEMNNLATKAIYESKAGYPCELHDDILLSAGDSKAEELAYAIATNMAKDKWGTLEKREYVLDTLKTQLAEAPIDCPLCERLYRD